MDHASALTVQGFLEPDVCRRVRLAIDAGTPEPAEVLANEFELDLDVRQASLIEVDESTRRFLDDRLDLMRPAMVRHFGVPLTGREGLSIVRYPAGGFFRRHRDRASVPSWPAAARRRIAVVVFLSSSRAADAEGAFSGGALRLFRERSSDSTDIHPRMGMLVAFPASTAHEVTVVEGGVRDVLVDWYH